MSADFDLAGIDPEQLGRLMEVLAEGKVEECDIEQGENKVSIRRTAREPRASPLETPVLERSEARDRPITVCAPAVGIFYRSEDRSSPPCAEVGSRVKVGDALGCIQVMAVPHIVFSSHQGTVESFLVETGQPVEYGQPIASIQPLEISY